MNPLDAVQMVNFFPTPTDVNFAEGATPRLQLALQVQF
jgi:hypothetical protein